MSPQPPPEEVEPAKGAHCGESFIRFETSVQVPPTSPSMRQEFATCSQVEAFANLRELDSLIQIGRLPVGVAWVAISHCCIFVRSSAAMLPPPGPTKSHMT